MTIALQKAKNQNPGGASAPPCTCLRAPLPSSLILYEVLQPLLCLRAAPALWNGLPKDLRQFAHPPNRALNFTYPPLALSSATFHSRLKTELFNILFYPG